MKAFGNGTFRRQWQRPGAWRLLLLAAFLPFILPLDSGGAHATGASTSAPSRYLSAGTDTWRRRSSGTDYDLYGIVCPTSRACLAVGDGGTILASADGGATWRSRSSGTDNNLISITCPTSRACLAVGDGGTILA